MGLAEETRFELDRVALLERILDELCLIVDAVMVDLVSRSLKD